MTSAADLARSIYASTLAAVRGDVLVRSVVSASEDSLTVSPLAAGEGWASEPLVLGLDRRVRIAGAGKASVAMAQGLSEILGNRVFDGLVVSKEGDRAVVSGAPVRVTHGNHPVPGELSLNAGAEMLAFARSCRAGDLVLFCLSGGASALMEDLAEGVDLASLQNLNRTMLASGATIQEINLERKRLSNLKGGKLAASFGGAEVVVLVLSDVLGNDLPTIGSAPLLASGVPHVLVGDRHSAERAADAAAKELGLVPFVGPVPLEGEARDRASVFTREGLARLKPGSVGIGTGETVVTLHGPGKGGRAQEFAMAAAAELQGHEGVAVLCGSTDGSDGPGSAAGGIVEADSIQLALNVGVDWQRCMETNDSQAFLEACGGLLVTGPTGSNVNDLALIVRAETT